MELPSPVGDAEDRPPTASWIHANLSPWHNFKFDLPASVVVFLVALPLCLGIALASGVPLMAGIVSGIVGGVIVSWLSGSALAVSGPAAGLTVVVLDAVHQLGSFETFLVAVVLAGVIQLGLGLLRAGLVAYYFPTTVIKGLLAAIGVILILKQIPRAIGFDQDYEGDFAFQQPDGRNTFTEITAALNHVHGGAVLIAALGLLVFVLLERFPRLKKKWLPAPLIAVVLGIALNALFEWIAPSWANRNDLLVRLPSLIDGAIGAWMTTPSFNATLLSDPTLYKVAMTLAVVASIETLLCVEAMDKIDPFRRSSDPNRELRAQGIGNIVAGALGGIPITAVIVRGSANVLAGGRTPMASFGHGVLLFGSVLAIPEVLNRIPLAALAAILLHVGYKLAPPSLFVNMYRRGTNEFIPFVVTVLAILLTDLLVGVAVGMAVGIFFILKANLETSYDLVTQEVRLEDSAGGSRLHVEMRLSENLTFLNKASIRRGLREIPDGATVEIDASSTTYIDRDVLETIHEFTRAAIFRGINVVLLDVPPVDAHVSALVGRRKRANGRVPRGLS